MGLFNVLVYLLMSFFLRKLRPGNFFRLVVGRSLQRPTVPIRRTFLPRLVGVMLREKFFGR